MDEEGFEDVDARDVAGTTDAVVEGWSIDVVGDASGLLVAGVSVEVPPLGSFENISSTPRLSILQANQRYLKKRNGKEEGEKERKLVATQTAANERAI